MNLCDIFLMSKRSLMERCASFSSYDIFCSFIGRCKSKGSWYSKSNTDTTTFIRSNKETGSILKTLPGKEVTY
jgi:hypothetical protein